MNAKPSQAKAATMIIRTMEFFNSYELKIYLTNNFAKTQKTQNGKNLFNL